MKKKITAIVLSFLCAFPVIAQDLKEGRDFFDKKQYDKALPIFEALLKKQPNNPNYNYWFGVSAIELGSPKKAIEPLRVATRRGVSYAEYYLALAYNDAYDYENAISTIESYLKTAKRRKESEELGEALLRKIRSNFRMLKGVEEVTVLDSFVVDKKNFLETYVLGQESGKIMLAREFFKDSTFGEEETLYLSERGNKIYYGAKNEEGLINLYSSNKLGDGWGTPIALPENINDSANVNYPFLLADGVTIYYASDGANSMGGYDIFVTRYNTNTNKYLMPENVGMPFNSPFNDYMFVIDEYNQLGWFASDRFQPEDKVCIYLFIPNKTKKIYNYEAMEPEAMVELAQIRDIEATWKDENQVRAAKERLQRLLNAQPKEDKKQDFNLLIVDGLEYTKWDDFKSDEAKQNYQQYVKQQGYFEQQKKKLTELRQEYGQGNETTKSQLAPAILDLEQRVEEMHKQLHERIKSVRKYEVTTINK